MTELPEEGDEIHLPREAVTQALRAGLYWSGIAADWSTTGPEALVWLAVGWGAGDEHLPITLVHDLGHLLLDGPAVRLASGRDLAAWPVEEQPERLIYEERTLARWLLDPVVEAIHVALAGLPGDIREAACAHAIRLALARPLLNARIRVVGNAAHLRALGPQAREGLPSTFSGWTDASTDATWSEWLAFASAQHQAARATLPTGPLFQPEDLWEIEHFRELQSESQRLALRQIHAQVAQIGPVPAGLAGRMQRATPEVAVEADDAAQFPAGGFDAISQSGRFENLVRSEVAYVGEAVLAGGVDAFDVRFVLNELLYYTRDESPLLDAHRRITVVIDAPATLREKHPGLPVQTLVLAEALYLALHDDLVRVFGATATSSALVWRVRTPEDRGVLEQERQLLQLSLAAALKHGRVTFSVLEPEDRWPAPPLVVLSHRAAPGRIARRVAWVRLDGTHLITSTERGAVTHHELGPPDEATPARPGAGLRALANHVLLALFGGLGRGPATSG